MTRLVISATAVGLTLLFVGWVYLQVVKPALDTVSSVLG